MHQALQLRGSPAAVPPAWRAAPRAGGGAALGVAAARRQQRACGVAARAAPEGALPEGSLPTMLNNCPHPREVRQWFYKDLTQAVMAALADGRTRMQVKQEFPELNVEQDVYRIGTLLEGVRELAQAMSRDGKRVRVCVQGSMGQGYMTAMPLALAGVSRILASMEWGEDGAVENEFIRLGSIGGDQCAPDDDAFILIAPQNITGYSVLPALQEMVAAAGPRPMVLINPRLGDIPSAGGVMSVRGREDRLAFIDEFEQVYHFRLLYRKPFWFPIYGVMRYSHGGRWEIYKRLGRMTTEVYRFAKAFDAEPPPSVITPTLAMDLGEVPDPSDLV